jgi:hypothetical protein
VVNITMPDDMGASAILELTDAQGRLVVRRLVLQGNGTEQLRLDGLASGLYGLRLFDGVASWSAPLSVR